MPHLTPTTLTTDEQRLILHATAENLRDHLISSMALVTNDEAATVGADGIIDGYMAPLLVGVGNNMGRLRSATASTLSRREDRFRRAAIR